MAGARARPLRMRQGIEMTSRARDMVFPRGVGLCSTTERLPGGAGSAGVGRVLTAVSNMSQTERCNMTLHQQLTRKSSPGHKIKVLNSRASADMYDSLLSSIGIGARGARRPKPPSRGARRVAKAGPKHGPRHDASRAAPPGRVATAGGGIQGRGPGYPPVRANEGRGSATESSRRDSPLALHMSHRTERL